ncbi:hypothetical protein ILFOPFJJ_02980 [Ensifer psoraleae]|nr:hypothetical protein [Sinorhizobium psoraleae]
MKRRRNFRPIIRKKPPIEGEPPRFRRSPLEGLSRRESDRYWMVLFALALGALPGLIALKAIAGHWWVATSVVSQPSALPRRWYCHSLRACWNSAG